MIENRLKGSFNQMMENNQQQNFMNLNYLQMIEKVQKMRNSQNDMQASNFQQIFNNEALRKYIQSVSQGQHQSNNQVSLSLGHFVFLLILNFKFLVLVYFI